MPALTLSWRDSSLRWLLVTAALAACVMGVLVSSLLLVRRFAGHFEESLSSFGFLCVCGALLALTAAPRLAGTWLPPSQRHNALRAAFLVLPALVLFMLGASLSSLSPPRWPLVVVWLAILAEEGAWWTIYFRGRRSPSRPRVGEPHSTAVAPEAARQVPTLDAETRSPEASRVDGEFIPPNVVLQMTRVRDEHRHETLFGVLRCAFAAGERNQNLHLSFCPPLGTVPELSFEQIDGPPATIKAAQVESFGARLEVRLDAPQDGSADVLLEFSCREVSHSDLA